MSKPNSRALRQLAEELVQEPPDEGEEMPECKQQELVTSLVRQWITYDGIATLFNDVQQVYLVVGKTPLGKPRVIPEPGSLGWLDLLSREWKITPDDLPDIIDQLNLGQSAEVTNQDGIPLRLWVNPKERSRGIEPLIKEKIPQEIQRDYCKIAASVLEQHLGDLDQDEMEALACSVAQQWQKYEGHACLFVGKGEQLLFTLTEMEGGNCRVNVQRRRTDVEGFLGSFGLSQEAISDAIARINLGQEAEFQDRQGVRCRLWHNTQTRKIVVEQLRPASPPSSVPNVLRC